MCELLLGGRGDGDDLELARVERAAQSSDGAPLAGRVPALEDDDARDALVARAAAEARDLALGVVEALAVLLLGQALIDDVEGVHPVFLHLLGGRATNSCMQMPSKGTRQ